MARGINQKYIEMKNKGVNAKAKINRLLCDSNRKEEYYKKEVGRWKANSENKGVVCIWGTGG